MNTCICWAAWRTVFGGATYDACIPCTANRTRGAVRSGQQNMLFPFAEEHAFIAWLCTVIVLQLAQQSNCNWHNVELALSQIFFIFLFFYVVPYIFCRLVQQFWLSQTGIPSFLCLVLSSLCEVQYNTIQYNTIQMHIWQGVHWIYMYLLLMLVSVSFVCIFWNIFKFNFAFHNLLGVITTFARYIYTF